MSSLLLFSFLFIFLPAFFHHLNILLTLTFFLTFSCQKNLEAQIADYNKENKRLRRISLHNSTEGSAEAQQAALQIHQMKEQLRTAEAKAESLTQSIAALQREYHTSFDKVQEGW